MKTLNNIMLLAMFALITQPVNSAVPLSDDTLLVKQASQLIYVNVDKKADKKGVDEEEPECE